MSENSQDIINRIKATFDRDPEQLFANTEYLTDREFLLIGKIIQLYCTADLNMRRIIDVIRHAALGPENRNGSLLQDAQVIPKLLDACELLPDSQTKEGILKAAESLKVHRDRRHDFAHAVARRVKGEQALILFSKKANEAMRRTQLPLAPDDLSYVVLPQKELEIQMRLLHGHTSYLATIAANFELNFADIQTELKKSVPHT